MSVKQFFKSDSQRVLTFTLLFVVAIAAYLTINEYNTSVGIFQEKELSKLSGIANSLALSIDAQDHQDLMKAYGFDETKITNNEQDDRYFEIHSLLKKAVEVNKLNSPVYTMIRSDSIVPSPTGEMVQKFCFGVSSAEKPYWKESYTTYPKDLIKMYDMGGVIPPYKDENGYWLSAFAPIKNAKGSTVGVLQVDEKFDSFIMKARDAIYKNILWSLFVLAVLAALMIVSVRNIVRKQERLKVEKEELAVYRKELIANVSHDLRTPLASIHGYIETILLMRDKLSDEKIFEYLNVSLNNAQKLKGLVDELFELSKLESNERQLNLEKFSMAELTYDVINNFKIAAGEKEIRLNAEVPVDLPMVEGDVALIDRVLQNLITNSIKYSTKGDKISVSLQMDKNLIAVAVQDTGRGIADKDLEHLFDRFYQGTDHAGGAGLGLAIVKNILELHGSDYHIESKLGKGTTFSFCLKPVAKKQVLVTD